MIQHDYVEQLERDLAAMKLDRDELKAAFRAQVKQQSDSARIWAKESAALKISAQRLERENAALREDRERLADTAEEVLRTFINLLRLIDSPRPEDLAICRKLRAAIDAARTKEAKP